jgi:phospholipase C
MHHFTADQVLVISTLARAFSVSHRWHASAPCQTWPNPFFAHTGTADGYVNNSPTRFPYEMETVFNRLSDAKQEWRISFHDMPQAVTLVTIWGGIFTSHFTFTRAAAFGRLPTYSIIEPTYFTDLRGTDMASGEQLIAAAYKCGPRRPGLKAHTAGDHLR